MFSPSAVISSDPAGFSSLVVWVVGAVLAILATRYLIDHYLPVMLRRRATTIHIPENVALHAKPLLTEAEARFFRSLEEAVDGEYLVWPQLPLWTFIDARSSDAGAEAAFKNRINLKRVDFTLVDHRNFTVWKAIELDDRTHQRSDRQHRDALVERVLKQAGVPLVRIPGAKTYDPQTLRKQLGLEEADRGGMKLAKAL